MKPETPLWKDPLVSETALMIKCNGEIVDPVHAKAFVKLDESATLDAETLTGLILSQRDKKDLIEEIFDSLPPRARDIVRILSDVDLDNPFDGLLDHETQAPFKIMLASCLTGFDDHIRNKADPHQNSIMTFGIRLTAAATEMSRHEFVVQENFYLVREMVAAIKYITPIMPHAELKSALAEIAPVLEHYNDSVSPDSFCQRYAIPSSSMN